MRRTTAPLVALALLLCVSGASLRAADDTPYVINAVISLTGPSAFVGQTQMESLQLAESAVNRTGGIGGRPLKFVFSDDQGSPQLALQLISRLVAQDVPLIMGPSVAATCAAAMPLVLPKGPVLWCMSPAIFPPAGSYVFASGATLDADAVATVRYLRERGWKRLAAIATTDGSGQAWDHGIASALSLPENKDVQMVDYEHMNPSDISAVGQIARIKAAHPQAVLTLATGTPWGTIMREIRDAGLDVPIAGSQSNAIYDELEHFKDYLPRELYFPGLASVVPGSYGSGPVQRAESLFFSTFEQAHIKPDIPLTTGWDPAMIVASGLRSLGPNATSQQLRDYILGLHGWAGVEGMYDFGDGQQRGVTVQAIVVDRWDRDASRFVAVSRPGGLPR